MSRVLTLPASQLGSLGDEILRLLGLQPKEPLVLIQGEDFVLVKKTKAASLSARFEELSAKTRERFEGLDLAPDEVENAVRWARGSS